MNSKQGASGIHIVFMTGPAQLYPRRPKTTRSAFPTQRPTLPVVLAPCLRSTTSCATQHLPIFSKTVYRAGNRRINRQHLEAFPSEIANRTRVFLRPLQPLDGHVRLPRKGTVSFPACLCSERRAEAHLIFSIVRPGGPLNSQGFEEQCADFPHSFTFDNVSQLDHDISTLLTTAREWRNSFLPINRIPLDVLSLLPTHLSAQKDLFRASFVCRHWRRTFLQHAALWSHLVLSKGEVYVKTLLERAKWSPLDITTNVSCPVSALTQLPPHTKQIRSLDFRRSHWAEIQWFSEVISGPLPLLRTLRIDVVTGIGLDSHNTMTLPTPLLFTNAVNLKDFVLRSGRSPYLGHFVLPNLTTFELSATLTRGEFRALELLNFLEASPMLRTVRMEVIGGIVLEGVPQERVVVLPDVETFSLVVSDGGWGYKTAAHISCPSARHVSLMHKKAARHTIPQEVLPDPVSWNAIARQYTRSPVEEVSLEMWLGTSPGDISCSLTFRSHGAAVILGFKVEGRPRPQTSPRQVHYEVFSQVSRTIREHPLLGNVKRVRINHGVLISGTDQYTRTTEEVRRMFESMGPLEKFTICNSDLYLYLSPPVDGPEPYNTQRTVLLPPIKELTISHASQLRDDEKCIAVIAELAKSHHAAGIPFERVTIYAMSLPPELAERLRPWVGAVDCYEGSGTLDVDY